MTSKILIAAVLVVLVAGLMWLLLSSIAGSSGEITVPVRRGEFVVRVHATGRLESGNAQRVEAGPRGKIVTYLAPEGTMVKAGDVLARFDDTELRERVLTRGNDLKMAEARRDEKVEQMAVREQELNAQITRLEAELAIKRTQYERLRSLPHPDDVTRARLERDYRKSQLDIAQQDLEIIRSLAAKGSTIFSKEEMREKELAFAQAKGDLEKAENVLRQVLEGAPAAELEAARRELAKAQIDLDEARENLPEQTTILKASLRSAEAEVDKMKVRLERTQKELDEREVKSPDEGMLVYRTVHGRPLELGDQFWHTTHLFDVADLDNMIVRVKVGESEFSRVALGQPVDIRVYSVPDRLFTGNVLEVAKVAKDKSEGELISRRNAPARAGLQTVDVLVGIIQRNKYLRPNVEAEVIIVCETIPDALTIPVDAVFERDGRSWVRVLEGSRAKSREVTLGVRGSDLVQVTAGLTEGEAVLLKLPAGEASPAVGRANGPRGGGGPAREGGGRPR